MMKKKIYSHYIYLLHILIFISCYLKSPKICAILIKISLFKHKKINKNRNKKISLVLYRSIGERDVRIIEKFSNKIPQIIFMRRSVVKLIFYFFSGKKKIFFNYLKPGIYFNEDDYFNLKESNKIKLEKFWIDVIYSLKKLYQDQISNIITFNSSYFAEILLYAACKKTIFQLNCGLRNVLDLIQLLNIILIKINIVMFFNMFKKYQFIMKL